jgi:lipoprotein-anchoring transpeptidase ErfK/SrfK
VKLPTVFALLGLSLVGLTGCVTDDGTAAMAQATARTRAQTVVASNREPWVLQTPFGFMYSQTPRETVQYSTREPVGTIIVDTPNRYLYYVSGRDEVIRYSIAVGGEGYDWSGTSTVSAKREWPDWTPTPDELKRFPNLPKHMPGGQDNPLGARALYLGATLYRIHGTNEPWKLGTAVSSGCIRLSNEDIVDLYNRAKIGAKVIVRR